MNFFLLSLLVISSVLSSPLSPKSLSKRLSPAGTEILDLLTADPSDALISLTSAKETTLNLPNAAALAAAAYCDNVRDGDWDCIPCSVVPDLELIYETGDGSDIAKVYVGYSPSLKWLVVSHEGTELNFEAWANDLSYTLTNLDSSLNNGAASSSVQVHEGFQAEFLKTSPEILAEVKDALAGTASGATLILVAGHSLGAALGVFESINLKINLATSLPIQMVGFGQPRVGNPEFVTYYESLFGDNAMHYTNQQDPVPHLPLEAMGFEQTQNEIYYDGTNTWLCPGLENESCANSNLVDLNILDHLGPYFGIEMVVC